MSTEQPGEGAMHHLLHIPGCDVHQDDVRIRWRRDPGRIHRGLPDTVGNPDHHLHRRAPILVSASSLRPPPSSMVEMPPTGTVNPRSSSRTGYPAVRVRPPAAVG